MIMIQASLIGQAPQKLKGKMARMVATKAALSIRVDALSDAESRSDPAAAEIGISNRVKLESRLRALEHRAGIQSVRKVTTGVNGRSQPKFEMTGAAAAGSYNPAADSVQMLPTQPIVVAKAQEERAEKESKKDKKKRKSEVGDVSIDADGDESMRVGETKEERKARKEAKKAVSRVERSNGIALRLTELRPRLRRRLQRKACQHQPRRRRSRRSDEPRMSMAQQRTARQWPMGRRRRRRRRETPRRPSRVGPVHAALRPPVPVPSFVLVHLFQPHDSWPRAAL